MNRIVRLVMWEITKVLVGLVIALLVIMFAKHAITKMAHRGMAMTENLAKQFRNTKPSQPRIQKRQGSVLAVHLVGPGTPAQPLRKERGKASIRWASDPPRTPLEQFRKQYVPSEQCQHWKTEHEMVACVNARITAREEFFQKMGIQNTSAPITFMDH